jgi:hypothetical protein
VLKSTNHYLVFALALGLFAFGTISAPWQPPPSARQENAFIVTLDILKAFYPEVFGKGWYFNVSTGHPVDDERGRWGEFSGFKFGIKRFPPTFPWNPTYDQSTAKMTEPPENTTFLEGRTRVGHDGEIISFLASGELARSQQNDAMHKLIDSHPERSEDQEIHTLKEAGAKYGPADKEQFMKSLHLEKSEKILGRLKILLIEFNPPSPDHVGNFAAGAFQWVIHAEAELPDGTHTKYALGFEPFDGRLIGIHRMN